MAYCLGQLTPPYYWARNSKTGVDGQKRIGRGDWQMGMKNQDQSRARGTESGQRAARVRATVVRAECQEFLSALDEASVDAVVTDPPYGLSFMGKGWDYQVPGKEIWKEVLRVLKPGGHLLSFFGSRTYHRGVVEIEDAGFEIRDCVMWVYGSGFPKSLDVGKAIDKEAGAERRVVGQRKKLQSYGYEGNNCFGGDVDRGGVQVTTAPATPAAQQWDGWGTALKPAHEPIVVARKPLAGTVAANVQQWGTGALNIGGCRVTDGSDTGGEKPEYKPNYGNQVFGHGKGGGAWANTNGRWPANLIHDGSPDNLSLLGDAARFFKTCEEDTWQDQLSNANTAAMSSDQQSKFATSVLAHAASLALPAALQLEVPFQEPFMNATEKDLRLLCESATQMIRTIGVRFWLEWQPTRLTLILNPVRFVVSRERTGITTITASHWTSNGSAEDVTFNIMQPNLAHGEKGSKQSMTNRLYYCAKASKSDRGPGNTHPTVKPTELMRYLVRLVTPPGGTVLDPFCGSGSTGVACVWEGFRFLGVEQDEQYAVIARSRIKEAQGR